MRKKKINKRLVFTSMFCIFSLAMIVAGCFNHGNSVDAESIQKTKITYSSADETEAVSNDELESYYEIKNGVDGVAIKPSWQYLDKASGSFIELPNDKKLSINDTLQLTINYTHVSKPNIASNNNTIRYQMPEELAFMDSGWKAFYSQNDSSKKAGDICVQNGYVYIRYEDSWMSEIQDNDVLGTFMAQGNVDISKIDDNGIVKVNLGDEEKELHFENDGEIAVAPITLDKSISDANKNGTEANKLIKIDGKRYVDYILTATVQGDASKIYKNVQVADSFTNTKYIKQYCGVTGEEAPVKSEENGNDPYGDTGSVYLGIESSDTDVTRYTPAKNSESTTLVWNLGAVQGGQTYQLHYRVEVKSDYANIPTDKADDVTLENKASVWYKKYLLQKDQKAVFMPKGTINMAKKVINKDGQAIESNDILQKDSKGNLFIQYSVTVNAPADNTWTFKNVYFTDSLYSTEDQTPKYLSFDKNSFTVDGTPVDSGSILSNSNFVRFLLDDFEPGSSHVVSYKVKVDPAIYTFKDSDTLSIRNTATSQLKDADGNYSAFAQSSCVKNIANKKWARKLTDGVQTEEDETIDMNGNDVIVPKGSFKYQIVVNEKGGWNVNKALFKDKISNADYMQYVGLLRINAYDVSDINVSGSNNSEIVDSIVSSKRPEATGWMDIDGKASFEVTPDDVLSSEKNYDSSKTYAYVLTYYTKTSPSLTEIRVQNRFYLNGDVGYNGHYYNIVFSNFSVDVNIPSSTNYQSSKKGWYYDKANKKLYWIIQLKPEDYPMTLPEGFSIKDTPLLDSSGTHMTHITNDSKVSVLKGTIDPSKFDSYDALEKSGRYESISYTKTVQTNSSYGKWNEEIIRLNKSVVLDTDESLFVVVETNPSHSDDSLPNDRSTINYRNTCYFSSDGKSWSDKIQANYMVAGRDNMIKELEMSFAKTDNTYTMLYKKDNAYNEWKIAKSLLKKNGTYYTWGVIVNYEGNLSGDAVIEDEIPEGLELSYLQYYWCGSGYSAKPTTSAYDGDGWTKVSGYDRYGSTISYAVKGNKIRWKVSGLQRSQGSGSFDNTAIQFHVTCRVSDKQTLMGGNTVKFTNNSSVYQNGVVKGTGTSTVSYSGKSISKVIDSENLSGNYVDFSVDLNALAEDLDDDSDRLTLVDELKQPLYFDTDSVKLYESDGTTEYSGRWTISYDYSESGKQIMRVNIPDGKHLILKYRAGINAKQGYIQINNVAHWEGYKAPENANIKNEQFSYTVSAVAGSSLVPKIQIRKMDAENSSKLQGAVFEIVAAKAYGEEEFKELDTPVQLTTDENGTATFGTGSNKLNVNTIYKIKEVKAPDGYILDSTPDYAVVIGRLSDDSIPEFGGTITDNGKEYVLNTSYTDTTVINVLNNKPEIPFIKRFTDSFSSSAEPVEDSDGVWKLMENGRKVSKFDGTYTFALNDGTKDIQWIRLQIDDGYIRIYRKSDSSSDYENVSDMKFTGLSTGKTYSIWELDSENNHIIENQSFISNDSEMFADYVNCSDIELNEDTEFTQDNTPVITNSKNSVLPNTGGKGWMIGGCIGIVMMLFAISGLSRSNKKTHKSKR